MTRTDDAVERSARESSMEIRQPLGSVGVAELSHAAVREQFSEYLDGSLSPFERSRIESHLVECRECGGYLASLRKTVEVAGELPPVTAPTSAKDRVLKRAREIQ